MSFFKKSLLFYSLFIAMAVSGQVRSSSPVIIHGKVISESTGKPVAHMHVYIQGAEEETLTDDNGEFRLQSWQSGPLRLTVDSYNKYRKESVVVSNPSQKQVIRLKDKS